MSKKARAAHVFERDALDWYVEPEWCSTALARVEHFEGTVYDPCCGGGNIPLALYRAGYSVYGTDIVERRNRPTKGSQDFFAEAPTREPDSIPNIMSNPPFFRGKGTERFIREAYRIVSHKLCVFTSLKFLGGDDRANGLYLDIPPSRVWMLTPRPSCPPGEYLLAGNKAGGGMEDWIWLVYDKTAEPGTKFGWLRRDGI